jgi:protein phosphatase
MVKPLIWKSSGKSDIGRVRPVNQDEILVDEGFGLFIVADGMGGHAGGEIASNLCINEIAKFLKKQERILNNQAKHPSQVIVNSIIDGINFASTKIYERALEDPTLKGMGTTATMIKIIDGHAYCGHVGDSRLYLLRCNFLYQITSDHSLVREQLKAGLITKEEAELHQLKNIITRSVGYQEEEYVDTAVIPIEVGDMFLLSSDGLHGKVSDQEIASMLIRQGLDAVNPLIDRANEYGGSDNISVVLVSIIQE